MIAHVETCIERHGVIGYVALLQSGDWSFGAGTPGCVDHSMSLSYFRHNGGPGNFINFRVWGLPTREAAINELRQWDSRGRPSQHPSTPKRKDYRHDR